MKFYENENFTYGKFDKNNSVLRKILAYIAIKQDLFDRNLVAFRQHTGASAQGDAMGEKSCALCLVGNVRYSGYSLHP